ncbi:AFG1-like ATPase [Hondaea fermentalgiana]|uniref:AFG1-like ATPase n=1 Tax=Hondaea fermentalgiana TaxID=2315210 RepID=A0A2R5H1G2_9STRA|nr:AFG1-like ATPase [Hondaea fermentalgiana]|eukprot:GBG34641.1 AFG1-like ATPase [Hondaea fermentalgiana]
MRRFYERTLRQGLLKADERQAWVVGQLDGLQQRLSPYEDKLSTYRTQCEEYKQAKALHDAPAPRQGDGDPGAAPLDENESASLSPPEVPRKPRGLYIHGQVGTGKTVLMDMFYETTNVEKKRRVHLHEFMIDVHQRIHKWKTEERARLVAQQEAARQEKERQLQAQVKAGEAPEAKVSSEQDRLDLLEVRQGASESDGISQVAEELAKEHTLLAFDEFVVNDVVDALILKHLFGVMFQHGVVVVATSNTAPEQLYKDGLNYFYFAPFIDILKAQCKVLDMDSSTDYRLLGGTEATSDRVFAPINPDTRTEFEAVFAALTDGAKIDQRTVPVAFGRKVVAKACTDTVCRFDFEELCGDREPVMGATDFKALCETFETIMIENVPVMGFDNHNETRRFITLVDQMYDRGVNIVLLADAELKDLIQISGEALPAQGDSGASGADELFSLKEMRMAAKRLSSRLVEMTSAASAR